jgi:hypothetical protein
MTKDPALPRPHSSRRSRSAGRSSRASLARGGRRRVGDGDRTAAPGAPDARRSPEPRPARSLAERLNTWIPMSTAVAALTLSVITWAQSRSEPDVTMNLPSIMRIGGNQFDVYIQPSFSVPREYDSAARISSVRLRFTLDGAPQGEQPEFFWLDSGVFGELPDGFGWTYEADPAPFVVGHQEPQRPTIRFNSEKQLIAPGRWTGTITADRGTGQDPLAEDFCVVVEEADMDDYAGLGPYGVIDFRNDVPGGPADCYWRPDHW